VTKRMATYKKSGGRSIVPGCAPIEFAGYKPTSCYRLHRFSCIVRDVREAALSGTVLCFLLILIKERTVLIASMLGFVAYSERLHFVFHGDFRALTYSYLFYGGAVLAVIIGVSFRFIFMKNPDFDPTYRRPDRENTWLGVVVVLGFLFGLGFVGIYLAWR
jgi:hypothetical protein